jgi:hypothetical protein
MLAVQRYRKKRKREGKEDDKPREEKAIGEGAEEGKKEEKAAVEPDDGLTEAQRRHIAKMRKRVSSCNSVDDSSRFNL